MAKQVPVYLFTGFLESGKTKFIQETLMFLSLLWNAAAFWVRNIMTAILKLRKSC